MTIGSYIMTKGIIFNPTTLGVTVSWIHQDDVDGNKVTKKNPMRISLVNIGECCTDAIYLKTILKSHCTRKYLKNLAYLIIIII